MDADMNEQLTFNTGRKTTKLGQLKMKLLKEQYSKAGYSERKRLRERYGI